MILYHILTDFVNVDPLHCLTVCPYQIRCCFVTIYNGPTKVYINLNYLRIFKLKFEIFYRVHNIFTVFFM